MRFGKTFMLLRISTVLFGATASCTMADFDEEFLALILIGDIEGIDLDWTLDPEFDFPEPVPQEVPLTPPFDLFFPAPLWPEPGVYWQPIFSNDPLPPGIFDLID